MSRSLAVPAVKDCRLRRRRSGIVADAASSLSLPPFPLSESAPVLPLNTSRPLLPLRMSAPPSPNIRTNLALAGPRLVRKSARAPP